MVNATVIITITITITLLFNNNDNRTLRDRHGSTRFFFLKSCEIILLPADQLCLTSYIEMH